MNLTLNPSENNLIKFSIGVAGTSSQPSKVRVFIGDDQRKICIMAKPGTLEKEWIAEIPLLTEILSLVTGPVMCSIEVLVNGRTFNPYNKEIIINDKVETIPVSFETKPEETHIELAKENIISSIEKDIIETKPIETELIKTEEIKPLLKDIEKSTFKEEKIIKPKKTYKLKPFNITKTKIKQDNTQLKDIMFVEDVDLSNIVPQIQKHVNQQTFFKITKKNIVYR